MLFKKRGVVLITVIIWIVIIGAIIIYAPRLYNWYVEQEKIKIIKSNAESVENEIKSLMIDKHPILIWNDADKIIKSLRIQNPITKEPQIRISLDKLKIKINGIFEFFFCSLIITHFHIA